MKSTRSVGCNHFEEMYVINPKEETYKSYDLMTYRLQSKRITYAYRRLHTNPSNWIKIKDFRRSALFFVSPVRKRTGEKPLILLGFPQFFLTN